MIKNLLLSLALVGVIGFAPAFAGAATGDTASCNGQNCSVSNPLKVPSVCKLVKELLRAGVSIGTPIAVLFIIWSGFRFVFAQGRPKELARARTNFYWTAIGVAVFLGAWIFAEIIAATINAIGGAVILSC